MKIKLVLFYFLANMIAGMEIQISIDKQELKVVDDEKIVKTYVISSSSYVALAPGLTGCKSLFNADEGE